MKRMPFRHIRTITYATVLLFHAEAQAQSLEVQSAQENISTLRQALDSHLKELKALKRKLADEEANLARLSRALDAGALANKRGAGTGDTSGEAPPAETGAAGAVAGTASSAPGNAQPAAEAIPSPSQPVGQAPVPETTTPAVAPIFDQPGVLTPKHKFVLEPSFQFSYSSSDRVALVGYTIIPALLIGLIDVREIKSTVLTAALAVRYGITNRMEVEVRVPYVYSTTDTISREIFTGSAQDNAFNSNGRGIGDVEMTLRYQFNAGGPDKFYYIGWLRFKTATGKSPFDVVTDCVTRCVGNTTGTGLPLQQPTGSGFYAIQPGLTWLFPSDPVVFFGNFSYLHSFGRNDLSLTIRDGQKDFIGSVQPGDIWGFNIGMGLALNEKASVSLGYDQSIVLPTKQNGQTVPSSVRVILGTLLIGYSYRLTPKTTLNLSIGAGLTRDTPDVVMTLRVPISF
ncbi:acetate kinase [Burkholderia sp. ABCPW 14]|uniref:acetate kinase n=1 Tax=Burkholderia sp. ABCPW 14 TaxID=1637860 RepID=UPI000770CFFF|nr:acetate kinase [Burkholderia sp. ABCPW 14]KVD72621.1 acetate kinase [Burkholderia sp. ABCPW 14]